MFILQVNSPGGHTSILSELLETRHSGGCIQPPAFIRLCILTFPCPLETLNSWQPGEMETGLKRLGKELPLSGPQCALLGNRLGPTQNNSTL